MSGKNKVRNGKIPEIDIEEALEELSAKGFVKTVRSGDTGIGATLEHELGIKENNFICHDLTYNDEPVELKAQRRNVSSNVTLITKSPYWDPLSAKQIIEKYGYEDCHGRPGLKVTLNANEFNSQGLKLELDKERLNIVHKTDGVICYFVLDDVMEKIINKLSKHLLLVIADSKRESGTEFFHFNEAKYFTELSKGGFIELIKSGIIVWEFRMHIKPTGQVRDHGAGFRIKQNKIHLLYKMSKEII